MPNLHKIGKYGKEIEGKIGEIIKKNRGKSELSQY